MNKLYAILLILLLSCIANNARSQGWQISRAEKAYEKEDYEKCIKKFNKALDKDADLNDTQLGKLANAYYFTSKYDKASKYYKETNTENLSGETLVNYGKILQRQGSYSEAAELFSRASEQGTEDPMVELLKQSANWASQNDYFTEGYEVTLTDLEIKGTSAGVQFYKDGIIYSKADEESRLDKNNINYRYNDLNYLPKNNGDFGEASVFSEALKFPYAAGATGFTNNYKRLYYTKKEDGSTKIFKSDYKNGSWSSNPKELSFNSDDYSCSMPTLSPDGQTMVFASDMQGGEGKHDLYVTYKDGQNWDKPRNLGTEINTPGEELFPYIDQNEVLYFSSNGINGFGGLDIFKAAKSENEWKEPNNLGQPVNSPKNDFAWTKNPENPNEAYIISNRSNSSKSDYLYHVKITKSSEDSSSNDNFLEASNESSESESELSDFLESTESDTEQSDNSSDNSSENNGGEEEDLSNFLEETDSSSSTTEEQDNQDDQATSMSDAIASTSETGYIYRVQFESSIEPMDRMDEFENRFESSLDSPQEGRSMEEISDFIYRYKYKGLYRYTVGEFYSAEPAKNLLKKIKNQGYEDAFIAVFEENESGKQKRVLDHPPIFKDNEN